MAAVQLNPDKLKFDAYMDVVLGITDNDVCNALRLQGLSTAQDFIG
jgi:hypothetical protein